MKNLIKYDLIVIIVWSNEQNRKDYTNEIIKKMKEKNLIMWINENNWIEQKLKKDNRNIKEIRKDIENFYYILNYSIKKWTIYSFNLIQLYVYSIYLLWKEDKITNKIRNKIFEEDNFVKWFKNYIEKVDKIIILNDKNYKLNNIVLEVQKEIEDYLKQKWLKNKLIKFIYKKEY